MSWNSQVFGHVMNWVNFLEAQPTPTEQKVYDEVAVVLERAPNIISDLQNYQGAGKQIREVICLFLLMRTKYKLCMLHVSVMLI